MYEIIISGLDKITDKLDRLQDILNDLSPEMELAGRYLIDFYEGAVWETEGSIINHPWQPLPRGTLIEKEKSYPGRGVLERTGALRYGFTLFTTSEMAMINNPIDYAKYHFYGTYKMPARIFMGANDEVLTHISEMIVKSITERMV